MPDTENARRASYTTNDGGLVLGYVDAFRWSWLISSDIHGSWFREPRELKDKKPLVSLASKSSSVATIPKVPRVAVGRLAATHVFSNWCNAGVSSEFAAGDALPRWYTCSGAGVRRLALVVGQLVALILARKYLHTGSVRLVRSRAVSRAVTRFFDDHVDAHIPDDQTRAVLSGFDFLTYEMLGAALLRASLHPYDPQNQALCTRLRIRLPLASEPALDWSQSDCVWAAALVVALYAELEDVLP
jgi:hypothetical protein